MIPESLSLSLLTILFALAAVAFMGVLNARGPGRTVVAAVLALLCLGAALWQTAQYRALRAIAAPAAGTRALEQPVEAPRAPAASQGPAVSGESLRDLADLVAAARALRDSLAAEDPSRARTLSDDEYQVFEGRAADHLEKARRLRERAARLAAAPPPGLEEAAEFLTLSLQSLNAAARDLRAFFRASSRDDEQRLQASFRQGIDSAHAPLRRAEARVPAVDDFGPQ